MARLGRGLSQLKHVHIVKLLQRLGNTYMERQANRHQYTNNCVFRATPKPFLSEDGALALTSLPNKFYHDVYERLVKQEAGNYAV